MRYADSYCLKKFGTDPATGEETCTFIGPCVVTGEEQKVTVSKLSLIKYRQGGYVQDCFPYLDKSEREFLISGMSGKGWEMTFGNGEEEDDEEDL
jgi:hypothetical protein